MSERICPSDALTVALGDWINFAVLQLDQAKLEIVRASLSAEGSDVQVVIRLREGAVLLQATKAGQFVELFREDVDPLRPDSGFEMPDTSRKQ